MTWYLVQSRPSIKGETTEVDGGQITNGETENFHRNLKGLQSLKNKGNKEGYSRERKTDMVRYSFPVISLLS